MRELFTFLKHLLLVFLALATLLPFLWMMGASFKPNPEAIADKLIANAREQLARAYRQD
jgi:ABC-type glycerol-3-phosphate transport system permease component